MRPTALNLASWHRDLATDCNEKIRLCMHAITCVQWLVCMCLYHKTTHVPFTHQDLSSKIPGGEEDE